MLEGIIEGIVKDDRGRPGTLLTIWVSCHNTQFKQLGREMKPESEDEVQKRKLEWGHLHRGKVMISQSD